MAVATALPKRSEVEEKYTWNLASIFPSVDDWRVTLKKVEESLPGLTAYKGHLGNSAQKLLGWFRDYQAALIPARQVMVYSSMSATRTPPTRTQSLCATRHARCSPSSTRRSPSQNRSYWTYRRKR